MTMMQTALLDRTYVSPTPAEIYAVLAPVIPGLDGMPHAMALTLASEGHQVEATWSYAPSSGLTGTRHWGSAGTVQSEFAVWEALRSVMMLPWGIYALTLAIPAEGPVTWSASGPALQPSGQRP